MRAARPTAKTPWRRDLAGTLLAFALLLPFAARAEDQAAGDWLSGDHATGEWGGRRSALEDRGLALEADYTGETFTRDTSDIAYRGNLDLKLTVDTDKAGLWKGGQVLVYGQDGHGDQISARPGFAMPVSNYEAANFTQLSEFWLYQELPGGIALRLGKQDANTDFVAPRFAGNFMNSSFGVLPTTPMPSYPAPALGVAAFVDATSWLQLRGAVYEGDPKVESFGKHAFDGDAGVFTIGAVDLHPGRNGPRDTIVQAGGWYHSADERSGAFAIADVLFRLAPAPGHEHRSMQAFVRTDWEPGADDANARLYVGGGATMHGFVGDNNTLGLGFGYVDQTDEDQGFLELIFKWRRIEWMTIEPDFQLYFKDGDTYVIGGLRCKLKL